MVAVIAAALGANQLWARRRTAGQAANEFAQAAATIARPLAASISRLEQRVAVVERENRNLSVENTRLRARIESLEMQLHNLGVKPEPEPKRTH